MHQQKNSRPASPSPTRGRKPYDKPKLIHRGDVRDVTMGPTPGIGESGSPSTLRP